MSESEQDYQPEENPEVVNPDLVLNQFAEVAHDQEGLSELIRDRVRELEAAAKPTELSIVSNKIYSGFIHSESRVVRNYMVEPFQVNDPEAYTVLADCIQELSADENWAKKSFRAISIPALQHALGRYFGNQCSYEGMEGLNRALYLNHDWTEQGSINLAEFKGKQLAVCAEKAALAQNYLKILGYKSEMIFSSSCQLSEENNEELHTFQIVTTEKGQTIYDPANPVGYFSVDGKMESYSPAAYRITEEQYAQLKQGQRVELEHVNYQKDAQGEYHPLTTKRIYGF